MKLYTDLIIDLPTSVLPESGSKGMISAGMAPPSLLTLQN